MVSLINKRVGKTDSVALTSGRYVITGTCTLWQLPVFVHVKLIVYFFFLQQVHYWLGSGSGHYKLGTGPIPLSSMYIDHTRHSTCTYTMMYKGQKQLCCNLFCNYFVSLSPHITLILATGTFLSAGRKSSQTTALYSSVCEYYVQIASPRVCMEFAAFQYVVSPPVLLRSGDNLNHERLSWAWNHRLWSSMPLIWDCEEGTIAQCLAFQLPVTGFFFFFNWPLNCSEQSMPWLSKVLNLLFLLSCQHLLQYARTHTVAHASV